MEMEIMKEGKESPLFFAILNEYLGRAVIMNGTFQEDQVLDSTPRVFEVVETPLFKCKTTAAVELSDVTSLRVGLDSRKSYVVAKTEVKFTFCASKLKGFQNEKTVIMLLGETSSAAVEAAAKDLVKSLPLFQGIEQESVMMESGKAAEAFWKAVGMHIHRTNCSEF